MTAPAPDYEITETLRPATAREQTAMAAQINAQGNTCPTCQGRIVVSRGRWVHSPQADCWHTTGPTPA